MRLIITRHGITKENEQGIVQGHMPGNLSEEGIKQGKKLAQRLKDEKINVIYTSSLARASDTARMIAEFHPNVELIETKELWEIDHGAATGKKFDEFDFENRTDKYETIEELKARAKVFIDNIMKKHKGETVLLVGHNHINQALVSILNPKHKIEKESQKNTAINIFEINDNIKEITYNCTKHLNA